MPREYPSYYVGTQVDGLLGRAEQLFVRDKNLNELIGEATFTDALFHILRGRLPSAKERALFDLVLVAFHGGFGLLPPTTLVPRFVAGTGVPVAQALAAGYLASGPYHVGAVEEAMRLYGGIYKEYQARQPAERQSSADLEAFADQGVADMMARGDTVPGFGHPLFRKDPRPTHMRRLLCDMQVESPYLDIYDGVLRRIAADKPVAPNVDGITAAILLILGFQPDHGTGLFLLARTAAMLAHVVEERTEMPYQTQKRFMILPILAPRLFNANFKWWSKFFNRLRDAPAFQRLLGLVAGNAKKPFLAGEAAELAVIAEAKRRRGDHPLPLPERTELDDQTGLGASTDGVGAPAGGPGSQPPGAPPTVARASSADEATPDEGRRHPEDGLQEPLAAAAVCLSAALEQLRTGPDACPPAPRQRLGELLTEAENLLHQAAALAEQEASHIEERR